MMQTMPLFVPPTATPVSPSPTPTRELLVSTGRVSHLTGWSIRSVRPQWRIDATEGCDLVRIDDSTFAQSELNKSDSRVVFWHVGVGPDPISQLGHLRGHYDDINRLALLETPSFSSPRLLASASKDDTVRLWNLDTWRCLRILRDHSNDVYGVTACSENRLASVGWDRRLIVSDVDRGSSISTIEGFKGELVDVISSSPSSASLQDTLVVSGACGDDSVHFIDLRILFPGTWDLRRTTAISLPHVHGVYTCSRLRDDSRPIYVTGNHYGFVSFWDIRFPRSPINRTRPHKESVWCIRQLPRVPETPNRALSRQTHDSFAFGSVGYDGDLRIWTIPKSIPSNVSETPSKSPSFVRRDLRTSVRTDGLTAACGGRTYGLCYVGEDEWEWGEFPLEDEMERSEFVMRCLCDDDDERLIMVVMIGIHDRSPLVITKGILICMI